MLSSVFSWFFPEENLSFHFMEEDPLSGIESGRYEKIRELGAGRFGVVAQVQDSTSLKGFAVKFSKFSDDDDLIRHEFDILEKVKNLGDNHHIIQVEFLKTSIDKPFLFLEFKEGRELFDFIIESPEHGLSLKCVKNIGLQVLDALEFLSSKNITHRDVKPENLLIDASEKITLIDFGFAFEGEQPVDFKGSICYLSPEGAVLEPLACSTDIWSLGVTLVNSYIKSLLFETQNLSDLIAEHEENLNTRYPESLQNCRYKPSTSSLIGGESPSLLSRKIFVVSKHKQEDRVEVNNFYNLIQHMLEFDPNTRIAPAQALNHPFFGESL